MPYKKVIAELNPQQQNAVKHTSGPLLVIAGAGSGKTKVITSKIAYLIGECGYSAKHVTAITFTNKAASEMLERSRKLLSGMETRGLTISTFHALGLKILKRECAHLGYKPSFSILDSYDSGKIISDLAKTTDKALVRSLQQQISLCKNSLLSPEELLAKAADKIEVENARLYMAYQDTLKTYQAVDFDDLIRLPLELFNRDLEVLYKWQQYIRYLLIDEYQDTNDCQYRLIKLLTQRHGMLTVVGDDDQSIYAWRGANASNILNLKDAFPNLEVIKLEQNYRSTTTILNAANNVIKENPKLFPKKLWSKFDFGEAIQIMSLKNDEAEADSVARKIMLHQLQYQTSLSDYAILYRSNHQARVLEQALRNYQLPYSISGGQSFFEKSEIKDITSYMRLIVNNDDDTAFIRAITTPKRGIGAITLEKLSNYATSRRISLFAALFEEGFADSCPQPQLVELTAFGNFINNLQFKMTKTPVEELLMELIDTIGYEQYLYEQDTSKIAEKRFGNILSFIAWLTKKATEQNKSFTELLHTITLITLLDGSNSEDVSSIKLSTLHAAKGLEYPHVYIISCEEGILPHQESINNANIEEERRLMYVGITRAEKSLTISYCETRKQNGELQTRMPSRFLAEMGEENINNQAKNKLNKTTLTDSGLQDRLKKLKDLLK